MFGFGFAVGFGFGEEPTRTSLVICEGSGSASHIESGLTPTNLLRSRFGFGLGFGFGLWFGLGFKNRVGFDGTSLWIGVWSGLGLVIIVVGLASGGAYATA